MQIKLKKATHVPFKKDVVAYFLEERSSDMLKFDVQHFPHKLPLELSYNDKGLYLLFLMIHIYL